MYRLGVISLGLLILLSFWVVSCSISPSSPVGIVYVSMLGSDNNDGLSPEKSVRSITKAVKVAKSLQASSVEIRIAKGVYLKGLGLNSSGDGVVIDISNITISGGWDESFSSVTGRSELGGDGLLNHVIVIHRATNVVLKGIVVKGGNAYNVGPGGDLDYNSCGGGIFVSNVYYLVIDSSVDICDNYAKIGGGIYVGWTSNATIDANIYSNVGDYGGGGVYVWSSSDNNFGGNIYLNSAFAGGGVVVDSSYRTTIDGNVFSNEAASDGGGIYLFYSPDSSINANLYFNVAKTNGGGMFVEHSGSSSISGSVYSNSSIYGGGISLYYSDRVSIDANVYGNVANQGGGMYTYHSGYIRIIGSFYNNKAEDVGGGIYLSFSDYFTNVGRITNNLASASNGGIFNNYSDYSYYGFITNNIPNDY